MLSAKHKFIFIHIPKTGGNSIHNALRPFSEDTVVCQSNIQDGVERFEVRHGSYKLTKHSRLMDYAAELPPSLFAQCKLITCVRNPWDRMISYYFSPHRRVSTWSRAHFLDMLKTEVQDSLDFLADANGDYHSGIQIIRFETLQRDFSRSCEALNLPDIELPHYNKSCRQHYREYYDAELVERVADKCVFEINEFGYEF